MTHAALLAVGAALRLEVSPEWDDNAARLPREAEPVASGALRALAGGGAGVSGGRGAVSLDAEAGARAFADGAARGEDTALLRGTLSGTLALSEGLRAALSADHFETWERRTEDRDEAPDRDLRSERALLDLVAAAGGAEAAVGGGLRALVFKPDADFDFSGPVARAALRRRIAIAGRPGESFTLGAAGQVERRGYQGARLQRDDLAQIVPGDAPRRDTSWRADLSAAWAGDALLDLRYSYEAVVSNSAGHDLSRHGIEAGFAVPLVAGVDLAARQEIQVLRYPEPPLIGREVALEDERRSQLSLALSRPVSDACAADLRYQLQAFAAGAGFGGYRRQVAGIGLRCEWAR